jgi:hydrogenase 3 maturation protease
MKTPSALTKSLKLNLFGSDKIAILGIGSELRCDDAAGMLVGHAINKEIKKSAKLKRKLKVFLGDTAPENLTGEIKIFNPDHIILIDSCDMNKKPGELGIISSDSVGGVSFSTHQIPLKILVDYIVHSLNCKALILGIQPKSLKYGEKPSKYVLKTVKELSSALLEAAKSVLN